MRLRVAKPANFGEVAARPASTLLMLREGMSTPVDVFMQLRHRDLAFQPNILVFPGGRMESDDMSPRLLARTAGVDRANPQEAGFVIAAIRETFEECGVLFARRAGQSALIDDAAMPHRDDLRVRLNARDVRFADLVESEELELAGDLIRPFARWITPWWHDRRFDTRFFLSRAPEGQIPLHDGGEAVDSIWFEPSPANIEKASAAGQIVPPTQRCLQRLGARPLDSLMERNEWDAFAPVDPWLERRAEGFVMGADGGPGEPPIEILVSSLSEIGIRPEQEAEILTDLAARGWPG